MNRSSKKRAVHLGFGIGIGLILAALVILNFAPAVWSGWATFLVVIGIIAALVGFVFLLVPARVQR